jgi:hypothetical protein
MKVLRSFVRGLLLFALSIPGFSQTFRGGIAGTLTDGSGAAISGAAMQAVNAETGLRREAATTNTGEFTFQDLPPGIYDVTATQTGFDKLKVDRVVVEVGKLTNLKLTLRIATQSQSVEVAALAVTIDTETSTLNQVIPNRAVQDMPLNGRDFTQLIKLAPGYNGAGSLNGSRTMQVNQQIDGADNNDGWHNAVAVNQGGVSGVAGTLLPIDAIDQFSVQSHANAESGRNGGGSVNMVIKSGGNSLHGTIYYFNRNDALATNTPFAPAGSAKPKLKNNQFGTSIGGPIVRDRLFFFLTYERQKFIVGNFGAGTEPSADWVNQATAVMQKYGIAVNPVSTNLLALWPARGRTGPATTNNFFSSDNSDNFSDNGIGKIDYLINSKNNLAFRYFVGSGAQTAPVGSPYHEYYQVAPSRMHNFSLVYNSVITSKFVAQTLLGVNYFKQTFNDFDTSANVVALGLNTGVTNTTLLGAPNITINGFDPVGLTAPLGRIDTTGHITETMSYTSGKHQFRFGGEYRRANLDVFYQRNSRGTFNFDGTQGPWATDSGVSSNLKSLADFLGGYVLSSSIQVGQMQDIYLMNSLSFFGQDSYKVSSNLTLNFGLRWEYFGPYHDDNHRFSVFQPGKGIVFVGQGIDSLFPKRYGNLAPRFGFAWSPKKDSKWVLRGDYGIYYDSPALNAFGDNRPPNSGATGVIYNPAGPSPIFSTTTSNYKIVSGVPVFGSNPSLPPPPYGVFSVDQQFKIASLQNYSLNAQYQLGNGVVAEVGYMGSLGRHLLTVLDINQIPANAQGISANRSALLVTRPFYSTFPNYATINQVESGANSHYSGMLASIRTSSWRGMTAKFNYTLGHSEDDASLVRGASPTDSTNLRGDYGNSSFDIRSTFTSYLTYELPAPKAGPRRLVRGWQINSLLSFYTGVPFTVFAGRNYSGSFEGKDRVDVVGDPFSGGPVNQSIVNGRVQWLNPAAFAFPASGTFGSEKRNQFYGPGFADVDLSIFKTTPINERVKAQFRLEMFNIFNRTNLPNANTTLSSGSFGQISTTIGNANGAPGIGAGEPFNVQLGLKIIF